MKWLVLLVLSVLFVTLTVAEGEIWEEDDHEVLIRNERGAKNTGKSKLILVFFFVVFKFVSFCFFKLSLQRFFLSSYFIDFDYYYMILKAFAVKSIESW